MFVLIESFLGSKFLSSLLDSCHDFTATRIGYIVDSSGEGAFTDLSATTFYSKNVNVTDLTNLNELSGAKSGDVTAL